MADNENNDYYKELEEEYITLIDDEGNEELYQILITFESEEFHKKYVLVYPADAAEEDIEIFAFTYEDDENGLEGELNNIETEEEWEMIEEVLGAFITDNEEE